MFKRKSIKIDRNRKQTLILNKFLLAVTRRAGWLHPDSKSNTVSGKI